VKRSLRTALHRIRRVPGVLILGFLKLYQRVLSPALPRRCKYEPTCSEYAVQAVRELGATRGSVLAAWRLARCNPFSHGGYDPVEARTLFRERKPRGGPPPAPVPPRSTRVSDHRGTAA
jgi:putative membrane protein insertion efficiency factor